MNNLLLAPLRGVTIRCFRETFAAEIAAAGFTEAVTPFISAMPGVDPLKDRELKPSPTFSKSGLLLTPQLIGKDPAILQNCLERLRDNGYLNVDLNCGCPFPMVRNKGRGSGLLRTPDVLRRMLEVGCQTLGPNHFSLKARLGIERTNELLALLPLINEFPIRFLTVHARTARQMYEGDCDWCAVEEIERLSKVQIVRNGDLPLPADPKTLDRPLMIGRPFIRALGERPDSVELIRRYALASREELKCDRPVLGRLKELLAYWKELPHWRKRWNLIKICRGTDELLSVI